MDYESVTDLPGIGEAYGSRLNQAGYRSAQDVYKKFKSYNFDSDRCQNWLNSVCGANSRYSSMCFQALRESPQQRHQTYRNETPEFGFLPRPSRQQQAPERILRSTEHHAPERSLYTQLPERTLNSPVQQSTASSKGSDISKAEVMQMMAEFRNKQDAMATRINDLEQEKSQTDNYIKTLETKIEQMNKKAAEVQKRQDAKIETLTKKLSVMDHTEQYKNISSSIYLLTQKFDDILTELNDVKEKSTIHCYVKAVETRIEQIEKKANMLQNQNDKMFLALNKMSGTNNLDWYQEVSSSINLLAQKRDAIIKQESEPYQDKKSTIQKVLDAEIKQVKHELCKSTIGIRNETKNNIETKKEELPNSHSR